MKKFLLIFLEYLLVLGVLLTGCSSNSNMEKNGGETNLSAGKSGMVENETQSVPVSKKLIIYAPASTSSIPVILAANQIDNAELVLYTNQSQANTLFLREDISILVTGLSVGLDLYKNGAPIQGINSFVSGLSSLVTYGRQISSFSELEGQQIYIPFEGSPIEEIAAYLASEDGLTWKKDILPVYSPFDSSIELLKKGTATAVILPEPNTTLIEGQPNIYIGPSLYDEWNNSTGEVNGYPQVASFVRPDWADENPQKIVEFNEALTEAILFVEENPSEAVRQVSNYYKLPAEKLLSSLSRTHYYLTTGNEMQAAILNYYRIIGKPIDENDTDFYFIPEK